MKATWKRVGCVLLVVALSAFAGCGDDDDGGNPAGDGGSGSGARDGGAGRSGGTGGTGGTRAGGTGGSGGTIECGNSGALSTACQTCIEDAVSNCGDECVALLNCTADKCAAAASESAQTACVTMCCLDEATAAVGGPGGRDTLGAAQRAQRMQCAAVCGGADLDGGVDAGN